MNKSDKNRWLEKVIDSSSAINRAEVSDSLFEKIEEKLSENIEVIRTIPIKTTVLAAASIAMLIVANVFLLQVSNSNNQVDTKSDNIDEIVEYYGFDDNTTNSLMQ